MQPRKTLISLSLAQRVEVLNLLESNETQISIANQFGVGQSVISRIKKEKDKILTDWQKNANPNQKRKRSGKAEDVEESLLRWFTEASSRQLPVTGPILREKAEHLAKELGIVNFSATTGWLERWKKRNNIQFRKQQGEKEEASYDPEKLVTDVLPDLLKNYQPSDIFNVDETALYWNAFPGGTLLAKTAKFMKISFASVAKERITVLLAANMDGSEKLEPLVIGKNKKPRSLAHVQNLPVAYEANNNAWMNAALWQDWLRKVDNKMREEKRKILMLCDNTVTHTSCLRLTNVKVVGIPPESTAMTLPMEQGIMANFKKHYRSLVLRHLVALTADENERWSPELSQTLSLLDGLHMIREAWNKTSATTIASCFSRAGFSLESQDDETKNATTNIPVDELIYKPEKMSMADFDLFIAIDDGLATEGDEFDTSTPVEKAEVEDEMSEITPPPTFEEALQAMDVISRYMGASGCKSYERFYDLKAELLSLSHKINTQNSTMNSSRGSKSKSLPKSKKSL